MRVRILPHALGALVLGAALASAAGEPPKPAASIPGFDVAALDPTANPCADFFQYACGGWMAANPIPADQPAWGRFNDLADRNRDVLRAILEAAAQPNPASPNDALLGDSFASCMDEAGIEKQGLAPLRPVLDRIAALASKEEIPALVAHLHGLGVGALFGFGSLQDMKDATSVLAFADQGGLGLPDRDYYVKDDEKSAELRKAYLAHVQKVFELAGDGRETAAANAQDVMAIETSLAKVSLDVVSRRDPNQLYHKMTLADLQSSTPAFQWSTYLTISGAPPVANLNVAVPDFFKGLSDLVSAVDLPKWRAYFRWHVLHAAAPLLPEAFVGENFAFYGKTLTGAAELRPRWKRCVDLVDEDLGEVLGQAFVARTFGADGKARMSDMVARLERALERDIAELPWMTEATKEQALGKLHAIANKIGYPDRWRDYSSLKVVRGDALGNAHRANAFEVKRDLAKIGRPVDRAEWPFSPPTVNAGYNPLLNDITFPAGILQPPFFDRSMDDAVNYGAIGAVIGHELTHGFDDEGRQFDSKGNLRDWWTEADGREFESRARCVEEQYGAYTAVDDVKVNGKLTLGENVADNGGVRISLVALLDALAGREPPKKDGLSPEQRFFLGWGQVWCQNRRPELSRMLAQVDPHAPARHRVNGVVANMPEFQKAFSCKAGDPMVRKNPCRVW